jgi:histidine triad (HIT) family protein
METQTASDCLFCKIANKQLSTAILYEDATVMAFYDIEPQAPIHALIIPKTHVHSAHEAPPEILGQVFSAASKIATQLGCRDSGYRVLSNIGQDAGQSVAHFHVHLLAGRALAWPPG